MVGPWSAEVVERHQAEERRVLCPFPGVRGAHKQSLRPVLLLRTAGHLRKEHYDLAINLRLKSWWISALIYLAAEPYTLQRYPLYFQPTAEEQYWVRQLLHLEVIDPTALLIVIHPGAGAAVKLWRSSAWAHCASWLSQSLAGNTPIHFILTGTVAEQPLLEEIARAATAHITVLTGLTIGQLAAVFQQAQLVLGVDSGPRHLAVAIGIPTVHIYGPIDPHIFGPWGSQEQHTAVVSTHRCTSCAAIPCGQLSFPERELKLHPCVKLGPEQEVLDAIAQHLSRLLSGRT